MIIKIVPYFCLIFFNFLQDSITKKWSCGKDAAGTWKKYYGRGAKQLSYNFNYGQFSQVEGFASAFTRDSHMRVLIVAGEKPAICNG